MPSSLRVLRLEECGCHRVSLPTFRKKMVPSSLRVLRLYECDCVTGLVFTDVSKETGAFFFEGFGAPIMLIRASKASTTSENTTAATRHHKPEHLHPQ